MKINPALLNKTYLQNSNTSQVKDDLGFKDFLVKKVEEVDQAQKKAENLLNALAKGEDVEEYIKIALERINELSKKYGKNTPTIENT